MDENQGADALEILLAERLWSVLGERLQIGRGAQLHCQSNETSPEDFIPRGIPTLSEETWSRI